MRYEVTVATLAVTVAAAASVSPSISCEPSSPPPARRAFHRQSALSSSSYPIMPKILAPSPGAVHHLVSRRSAVTPTSTFSSDYGNCQAWAAALAAHPQKPEGILYPSARALGNECVALFKSAALDCRTLAFGPSTLVSKSAEILADLADNQVDVLDEEIA